MIIAKWIFTSMFCHSKHTPAIVCHDTSPFNQYTCTMLRWNMAKWLMSWAKLAPFPDFILNLFSCRVRCLSGTPRSCKLYTCVTNLIPKCYIFINMIITWTLKDIYFLHVDINLPFVNCNWFSGPKLFFGFHFRLPWQYVNWLLWEKIPK